LTVADSTFFGMTLKEQRVPSSAAETIAAPKR